MDSIIGTPILLLTLSGMVLGAFLAYSITIIRKLGVSTYLKMIGQIVKAIAGALTKFVASVIGLLASSAKTSDSTEATANATRGGIFNHRTGKFDDGTDPAGWYEKN